MGCNRDKLAQELPQPTETAAQTQKNRELAAVAKALAQVLGTDAAVRQQLKAEALKRFDGDYDVLYQPFASGHADFNQRVSDAVASAGPDGLTMDGLLNRVPMLNISVPVNIEKWETSTYAPLVIFIPAGFSERTTKQVVAYDKDGKEHWLDAKVSPDFPVVVVGPSERVSSTTEAARRASYELKSILPGGQPASVVDDPGTTFETPLDGSGSGGGYTPLGTNATGCRTDKQTEFLRSLWMADVSQYESWFLGDPEIKLQIVSPAGSGGTLSATVVEGQYTMGRKTIEDTYRCNARLHYWDKAYLGGVLAYVWIEEDYGDIADVKFTFGYTPKNGGPSASLEVTYKIANHDDEIGKGLVFFDECPSQGYYSVNSGSTEFRWVTENRP